MNNNLEELAKAKINGGTITYHFENGEKQVSQINKEVFINEKTKKDRRLEEVLQVFEDTRHDLRAAAFTI